MDGHGRSLAHVSPCARLVMHRRQTTANVRIRTADVNPARQAISTDGVRDVGVCMDLCLFGDPGRAPCFAAGDVAPRTYSNVSILLLWRISAEQPTTCQWGGGRGRHDLAMPGTCSPEPAPCFPPRCCVDIHALTYAALQYLCFGCIPLQRSVHAHPHPSINPPIQADTIGGCLSNLGIATPGGQA